MRRNFKKWDELVNQFGAIVLIVRRFGVGRYVRGPICPASRDQLKLTETLGIVEDGY